MNVVSSGYTLYHRNTPPKKSIFYFKIYSMNTSHTVLLCFQECVFVCLFLYISVCVCMCVCIFITRKSLPPPSTITSPLKTLVCDSVDRGMSLTGCHLNTHKHTHTHTYIDLTKPHTLFRTHCCQTIQETDPFNKHKHDTDLTVQIHCIYSLLYKIGRAHV